MEKERKLVQMKLIKMLERIIWRIGTMWVVWIFMGLVKLILLLRELIRNLNRINNDFYLSNLR